MITTALSGILVIDGQWGVQTLLVLEPTLTMKRMGSLMRMMMRR